MQNKPTVSAWPAKGSQHGPHFWPLLWPLQVRSAQREEVQEPGFPSLPCSLRCLCGRLGINSHGQHEETQQVFSVPWKWFSTEQVTAPPYFLHTIISWVRALPRALAPASPLLRTYVRGGLAVSPSESCFFLWQARKCFWSCSSEMTSQKLWLCE